MENSQKMQGKWTVQENCWEKMGYIFKKKMAYCVNDWEYYVSMLPKTYTDAVEYCKWWGGSLTSINSREEKLKLIDTLSQLTRSYWIGLNDRKSPGKFVWIDGSGGLYRNWHFGEPNNHKMNEDCASLNYNVRRTWSWWNDLNCDNNRPFICKRCPEGKPLF